MVNLGCQPDTGAERGPQRNCLPQVGPWACQGDIVLSDLGRPDFSDLCPGAPLRFAHL